MKHFPIPREDLRVATQPERGGPMLGLLIGVPLSVLLWVGIAFLVL